MNKNTAYLFLRLSMGINFLGHGLVRLTKLQDFADGMAKGFEKSWLPQLFVQTFSTALPFLEFSIGLLLILGFKMRIASMAGASLIILLLFGSSTVENWEAMGIQMIYAGLFYILISRMDDNYLCADRK
ncbi:DoxX family protein [Chryseobacterium sp. BIGb0232]|uniref:DoxX family protein n=1 Tax=Chryseobacterium sp. BIGb0232 TaxID=2940598 RepID=UPI000F464670|nr:DoxX family protein [Chryseobacterium sp. BIGb0232]MCS4305482.1 thiosulfate dehydrogenase [quinone] large subunit [Chryseobacterium sp. BIGb0232]ROS07153.1 thiosulfate dehydrogenase [quinone] large subunit [Chryseobacterium nakagawai]